MDNLPSYELTPGMPVLSARQKRMLNAFELGYYVGLADEMYRMAEEDLRAEIFSVKHSMTLMLEDRDGPVYLFQLLITIHERVLVAIIKGTIGHELVSTRGKEDDLQKCMLPINVQAGTYLITFLKKDSNKYLSISQQVKVTRYLSFHESPLEDDPTPERQVQYEDAVKVEALLCPGYELSHIQDSVKAGKISKSFTNSDLFVKRLEHWYSQDMNELLATAFRTQSPSYVGCSNHISVRLDQHNPVTKAPKITCVTVFLACLKGAGIEFDRIEMAVLKVWEQAQFRLGEALVTMLAGSLVWEGGLNAVQAGGKPLDIGDVRSMDVCEELFFKTDWTMANLRKCQELHATRMRQAQEVADFDPTDKLIEFQELVKSVDSNILVLDQNLDELSVLIEEKSKLVEGAIKELDDEMEVLQGQLEGETLLLEFGEMYLEWAGECNE
ncbi:hypothetical protein BTUL_0071g00310 [Botrytis tulipae]|uniref:Uncharacterized protein n=1 Tax=Botrytis tulipae TaxID=87230 RepID=A0A4Z1ELN5_9HELO|nr:hypothetical protein BTUL_0071g00310 [Botrytis tulipae]